MKDNRLKIDGGDLKGLSGLQPLMCRST